MKKVLVTGGAGYIGSVLVGLLLEKNYIVRVLDNLSFGGEALVGLMNNKNFEFIKGDIRNKDRLERSMNGVDFVVHLASLVGDPACAVDPKLTRSVNLDGAKLTYEIANKKRVKRFIFASTCSNYGKMLNSNSFVNEDSELQPVSLYAETKVEFESFLLNQDSSVLSKPTCLRFSTVYGVSPRMRFDLTVNEFTKDLVNKKELIVFGEQFWRPYCHVVDLSRGVIAALEANDNLVAFNVFNVGSSSENYQKKMIVDEIVKFLPNAKIKYIKKDEDPRDYRVSFDKIKKELGFDITMRVSDGIRQIIRIINDEIIINTEDKKYKNI